MTNEEIQNAFLRQTLPKIVRASDYHDFDTFVNVIEALFGIRLRYHEIDIRFKRNDIYDAYDGLWIAVFYEKRYRPTQEELDELLQTTAKKILHKRNGAL